uniref:GIY-YIG domain-containing protein n=1 Tax=Trichoderma cornu-damae TaxID=654480 RepID=A0A8E6Z8G5_9HYPO|nr:hypothetical protein [Trichoderma cornu-damae]
MNNITPIISYINADKNKKIIFKDNIKKSGIYMWTNLINSKFYIGSSVSLTTRFTTYFSLASLRKRTKNESSAIYKALLKYSHNNFKLDIIEYCEPEVLIAREQYYIDLLKPEYNILKVANSRLGSKHTEVTKLKISQKVKGANHPFFGKEHTDESRNKIRVSLILYYKNNVVKNKSTVNSNNKLKSNAVITSKSSLNYKGIEVSVFDKDNNFIQKFLSIRKAAIYFNVSDRTMGRRLKKGYCNNFIYKSSN